MKVAMENLRNQMAELSPGQGGMKNYLGIQPLAKDAPRYWQSSPDSPPTELAYITDQEKELLLQANLHDSLGAGVPNQGPDGIMSLDGLGEEDTAYDQAVDQSGSEAAIDNYYSQGGGYNQASGTQNQNESAQDIINQVAQYQANTGDNAGGNILQNQQNQQAAIDSILAGGNVQTGIDTDGVANLAGGQTPVNKKETKLTKEQKKTNKNKQKLLQKQIDAENKLIADGKGSKDKLKTLMDRLAAVPQTSLMEGFLDSTKDSAEAIKKKLKDLGIIGKEIKDIESLPKKTQEDMMKLLNDFERLNVSPKEAMSPLMTTLKGMGAGLERKDKDGKVIGDTLEGLTKKLRALDTGGGASALESLKKYNPQAYFKAFGAPQTSGGLKNFAMNELATGDKLTKEQQRYNNAIFSAREQSRERNSNNQNNRPRFMEQTQEERS
jgi:hypothetical protein